MKETIPTGYNLEEEGKRIGGDHRANSTVDTHFEQAKQNKIK